MPGTNKWHVNAWRLTQSPNDAATVKLSFQRSYPASLVHVMERYVTVSGLTIPVWVVVARIERSKLRIPA